MKVSTKRALSLIGTAGLFIATLAVYSLLLRPAYEIANTLRGEYAARHGTFVDQSKIITKVRDLIAQYQGTTKIQDTIGLTLPKDESAAAMVSQIQAIAAASGLILQSLNLQTTSALKPVAVGDANGVKSLGVVEANVSLVGPYDGFKTFVSGIESNIRLMDIVEWRTEPLVRNNPNALSHNIVIRAYYQAE